MSSLRTGFDELFFIKECSHEDDLSKYKGPNSAHNHSSIIIIASMRIIGERRTWSVFLDEGAHLSLQLCAHLREMLHLLLISGKKSQEGRSQGLHIHPIISSSS